MTSFGRRIRETITGLEVPLHVQPRARCTKIAGFHGNALKVKISAPPTGDAANHAIVDLFAKLLDLPKSHFQIITGQKSRDKILRIDGISLRSFQQCIPSDPSG